MARTTTLQAIADQDRLRREIVQRADRIPSLREVVLKLIKLIQDENSCAADLEKHLANDQSLMAKILRVVNSPLYGLTRKVTSVRDCVVVLGMRGIKSLVLAANTAEYLDRNFAIYGYAQSGLWIHSVAVAAASRALAVLAGLPAPMVEELFVSGLLHDVGKVVLGPYLAERGIDLARHGHTALPGLVTAEEKSLGYGHHEAGCMVATRWSLGVLVATVVRHHHQPSQAQEHRQQTAIVHLADHLAGAEGFGVAEDTTPETPLDAASFELAGLTREEFDDARTKLVEEMRTAAAAVKSGG